MRSRHLLRVALSLAAVFGLAGCNDARRALVRWFSPNYEAATTTAGAVTAPLTVRLLPFAQDFAQITDIQPLPGTEALLVAQKTGELFWLDPLQNRRRLLYRFDVLTDSEQGLLGVAPHPTFAVNGRLFANVTQRSGNVDVSRVLELHTSTPADLGGGAELRVVRRIYEVVQPYPNHNAGQLAFGPDGMLYVGWGDGGWRGDPHGHGQNPATPLGSMLRLDVDAPAPHIPPDNPVWPQPGALPETWAIGLRNPWRFSFAPDGRLIVADVGQDAWEEISLVSAGDNLGWNVREGRHCYPAKAVCSTAGFVDPIHEYNHDQGRSITGGYVYTGTAIPALRGKYIFGDFITGRLWALTLPPVGATAPTEVYDLGATGLLISTFGRLANGELLVADFGSGRILMLAP